MPLMNEKLQDPVLKNVCLHVIVFVWGMFLCFLTTDYLECHLNPARDMIYMFIFWVVVSTSISVHPICIMMYGIIYDVLKGLPLGWTSLLWILSVAILMNQQKKIHHRSLEKKWLYFAVYFFFMYILNDWFRFVHVAETINYGIKIQSFLFSLIFFPYVYNVCNKMYLKFDAKIT